MKLSKAIKTLVDFEKGERASVEDEVHDAINLGIEALKRHQEDIKKYAFPECHQLPGETPETDPA